MRALGILLLGLVAAIAAHKHPFTAQRIVGGSVTSIEQYPDTVALLFPTNIVAFSQGCGGSILNERSVLTAAHCTEGLQPQMVRVRAGSTNANSGGVVHFIGQIFEHPEYNGQILDNDVSVIRTTAFFVFSNTVRPAQIAGPNYNIQDNSPVWATGWGLIHSPQTHPAAQSSEQLRHVELRTVNRELCRVRYAAHPIISFPITENMLCVGWSEGGRDQCFGDSGGPLYHNNVIVGVCSWGPPGHCGDSFYPGVNALVSRYTSWLSAIA